jgi:protocatechuate 3,4-dioxygenase beta subunit
MTSALRRRLVAAATALPLFPRMAFSQGQNPLTPSCGKQTAPQTAGPFFKPNSPRRNSMIEKDSKGEKLIVSGLVLSRDCKPVANALVDFWHADESGEYDNKGFRYRGHQFTDSQGRYRLETILPAEYPGRSRHIHVNVAASGKRILTTQLYFPERLGHHRDGLYDAALEMKMAKAGEGSFDFVVEA